MHPVNGERAQNREKDVFLTERTQLSTLKQKTYPFRNPQNELFLIPANPKPTRKGAQNSPGFGIEPHVSECYNEREKTPFGAWRRRTGPPLVEQAEGPGPV